MDQWGARESLMGHRRLCHSHFIRGAMENVVNANFSLGQLARGDGTGGLCQSLTGCRLLKSPTDGQH